MRSLYIFLGIIIVAGIVYFTQENKQENLLPAEIQETNTKAQQEIIIEGEKAPMEDGVLVEEGDIIPEIKIITYTETGFSPTTITIKKGSIVRFTNQSSETMWVDASPHSTYPEFDQKRSVSEDGIFDFKFDRVGTFKYHNHNKESNEGTVIVTQ